MKVINIGVQIGQSYITVNTTEGTAKAALMEILESKFDDLINIKTSNQIETKITTSWQDY